MSEPQTHVQPWRAPDRDQASTEPAITDLPVRPRRRRLTPTSALLVAVLLGFGGFYAGVRAEKSQATSTAATRSVARGRVPSSASAGSNSAFAGSAGLTAGTVSRVDGDTIYIKESSGKTVKVKLLATTTISKSESVSGRSIRPGDTLTIQGTQRTNGTIASTSLHDSGASTSATTTSTSSSQPSSTSTAG